MQNQLICELVTPEKLLFSGEVGMVEAPGMEGDFGVLAGHMNFISTLRPGIVTIHHAGNDNLRLFVTGGVAEVTPERCIILAEAAEDIGTLTLADAQARLADARKKAEMAVTQEEHFACELALRKAEALAQALA